MTDLAEEILHLHRKNDTVAGWRYWLGVATSDPKVFFTHCRECGQMWPCKTVRIVKQFQD